MRIHSFAGGQCWWETRKKQNAGSAKRGVRMEFKRLPPIGQRQKRPMDGAQFHSPQVGNAGGRLGRNKMQVQQNEESAWSSSDSHPSDKDKTSDGWGTVSFPAGRRCRWETRKKQNASSTKRGVRMEFKRLPPIGQRQKRPMDGAQFHSPWVGNAGGELKRN